ncbi:cellulose biosynthesis protein BcsG [Caballeronia sordidicola]|uniref:Inner membrane protein n=1 Tax=Caballeronia sordidicola TaxID=196367 RepID=A0A226WQM9_CABSO|nr:cellulose biosynthesis protein BcsG [Caballeronia sordidicola]OXC73501.1 inner membrane protein [Caballeronia sordidicola]
MMLWNLYFMLKLYLWLSGRLEPLWVTNIAFALALAVTAFVRGRQWRLLRTLIGLAVGLPLMYREAVVPPFARLVEELGAMAHFSIQYWLELAPRFVPPFMLGAAGIVVLLYLVVNRWARVSTLVIVALIVAPLWQAGHTVLLHAIPATPAASSGAQVALASAGGPAGTPGHDAALAAFRTKEANRKVSFTHLTDDPSAQFDIIVLHICSLSWDDLDAVKARNHPMLSHFDFLFTQFSTAASYSGPAAIRVLRATCGQPAHKDLYAPAPSGCYLLAALAKAGFVPQTLLNHDGHFDDFLNLVNHNTGVPGVPLIPNTDAPIAMHAFDDSPIREDYGVLANWYTRREQVPGPVALYYNTISLHDGNRIVGSSLKSRDSYGQRVNKLMSDFDRFADLIASSGRRAVIVFVPEHGAALRAEASQLDGIRELPTPHIVHGPVGVRLVNFPQQSHSTTVIDTPSSFLAVAQLLANMVANSPFQPGVRLANYAANLPRTSMVGENGDTVTMLTATGFAVKTPDGLWVDEQ